VKSRNPQTVKRVLRAKKEIIPLAYTTSFIPFANGKIKLILKV
jgi:hypothetical protein